MTVTKATDPATKTVYLHTRSIAACSKHTEQLVATRKVRSVYANTTVGAECENCINEAKLRETGDTP